MMMTDRNKNMARRVAKEVDKAGGRTFYVGGYVRDEILGLENKDIDIEVHGIPVKTLEDILDSLGTRLKIGTSFGIMGLRGYDLDIAMPRSEVATGRGHKDFEVFVDPFLGEEKAARRRDFTMNAMMEDVLTGEILDFFGGQEDLERKRIRHVDDQSFVEDPLRVFRAAQFAARFGFTVAEETTALSSTMDVAALPAERIMGELEKALLKAPKPSVFFEELRKMHQLSVWFPELEATQEIQQGAQHHPEGNVWIHTMQVLDEAARMKEEAREPLWFLLSAICHDLGKLVTTSLGKDGRIHAYEHEKKGVPIAERLLLRIVNETKLLKYVLNMVELHMRPNGLIRDNARTLSFMKLFDRSVCPEDLLLLAKADQIGRVGPGTDREAIVASYIETERKLREYLALYQERMSRPYVMGRDLLEAGARPGPLIGEIINELHGFRLSGKSREDQMKHALASIRGQAEQKRKE